MPTLTPVETDFVSIAPNVVVVEQDIAATPAAIWNTIIDNPGWVAWYPTMTRSVDTSEPAHGVGSTRSVTVGGLKAEERFVAWEPDELWAFTIVKTNVPMAKRFLEQVELIQRDATTTVRYTGAFEPMLITRPIAGFIEKQVRSGWTDGLAGLAAHLTG